VSHVTLVANPAFFRCKDFGEIGCVFASLLPVNSVVLLCELNDMSARFWAMAGFCAVVAVVVASVGE
jgi:hypothetical protein